MIPPNSWVNIIYLNLEMPGASSAFDEGKVYIKYKRVESLNLVVTTTLSTLTEVTTTLTAMTSATTTMIRETFLITGDYMIVVVFSSGWPTTSTTTATIGSLQMQVASNSSVSGLMFGSTKGLLNFTVSGPTGSYGFFDATIAKSLLSGQPIVMMDGVEHPASVTEDANFWYVHVTCTLVFSAMFCFGLGIVLGGGIWCLTRSMWYSALTHAAVVTPVTVVSGDDPDRRVDEEVTHSRGARRTKVTHRILFA